MLAGGEKRNDRGKLRVAARGDPPLGRRGKIIVVGIGKSGDVLFDLPSSSPDHGQLIAGYYFWLFPNLMLNFYPGNLQVNAVVPLDVSRTRTVFEWYALDDATRLEEAIAFSDRVQREDIQICQAVQKGLSSRSYDRGRFSVRRENGVHHFQLLLHQHLTG